MKKNELITVNREELQAQASINMNTFIDAVSARMGSSNIEVTTDTDGNEFARATFDLAMPQGDRKSVSTTDMNLATKILRIKQADGTEETAKFYKWKEMETFTETDAVGLGFDNVNLMCQAMFGISKSTVENYRRVARYFITDNYKVVPQLPQDLTISTLNELLSLVDVHEDGSFDISNIERIFNTGIMTPYMKLAEVKARRNTLKAMESDREIKDLSPEEVTELKDKLNADTVNRKATGKGKKKEETQNKVVVSDNPEVLAGEVLNKVKELTELAKKLSISFDEELGSIMDKIQAIITD